MSNPFIKGVRLATLLLSQIKKEGVEKPCQKLTLKSYTLGDQILFINRDITQCNTSKLTH